VDDLVELPDLPAREEIIGTEVSGDADTPWGARRRSFVVPDAGAWGGLHSRRVRGAGVIVGAPALLESGDGGGWMYRASAGLPDEELDEFAMVKS
jgi:hypothetical protein